MFFFLFLVVPAFSLVAVTTSLIVGDGWSRSVRLTILAILAGALIPVRGWEVAIFLIGVTSAGILADAIAVEANRFRRSRFGDDLPFAARIATSVLSFSFFVIGVGIQVAWTGDAEFDEVGVDLLAVVILAWVTLGLLIFIGVPQMTLHLLRSFQHGNSATSRRVPEAVRDPEPTRSPRQFGLADLSLLIFAIAILFMVAKRSWSEVTQPRADLVAGGVAGIAVVLVYVWLRSGLPIVIRLVGATGILMAAPAIAVAGFPVDELLFFTFETIYWHRETVVRVFIGFAIIALAVAMFSSWIWSLDSWWSHHRPLRLAASSMLAGALVFGAFTVFRLDWFLLMSQSNKAVSTDLDPANRRDELMDVIQTFGVMAEFDFGEGSVEDPAMTIDAKLDKVATIINSNAPLRLQPITDLESYFELDAMSEARDVGRAFVSRSNATKLAGNVHEATTALLDGFRFAQRFPEGGLLIDRLVSIAISVSVLEELHLLRDDWDPTLREQVARSLVASTAYVEPYQAFVDREVELASRTANLFERIDGYDANHSAWDGLLDQTLEPERIVGDYHQIGHHEAALIRLLMVDGAIRKHFLDHQSRLESLAELVPGDLDKVPIDPWSGRPINLMIRDDGYVIYCVGHNQVDDGGTVSADPTEGDVVLETKWATIR